MCLMPQYMCHVIASCMTGRIANAPLCILFPLSPFSSQGSHNCKREGNYNLLSMILQIDIPFPLLMNTFTFSCFFRHFMGIFQHCIYQTKIMQAQAARAGRVGSSILLCVFIYGIYPSIKCVHHPVFISLKAFIVLL